MQANPSKNQSVFHLKRDILTGEVLMDSFEETYVHEENGKMSVSLSRTPGHRQGFVRGKASGIPFLPGAFSLSL